MGVRRLFVCTVVNHPWAKSGHYYEEEDGQVQEIKLRQDGVFAEFDGYVGIMYPFSEMADACVEVLPMNSETVGVKPAKVALITQSNSAQ